MQAGITDQELLKLLRTDYRVAFKQLYKDYFRMVEYLVTKNSGSVADAEDVFQEIMIVIFNKSRDDGFALTCAVKTFIYSVARNLWLKKLRDGKQTTAMKDYEAYDNIGVEENVEQDDLLSKKINAAIETLGDNCRKILLLFYYQKKNMLEIAAELGYTNAENAKNQKYKCLQQLKSKMI
jgi:RNA polymerase sigma factor (sigma-70 family)